METLGELMAMAKKLKDDDNQEVLAKLDFTDEMNAKADEYWNCVKDFESSKNDLLKNGRITYDANALALKQKKVVAGELLDLLVFEHIRDNEELCKIYNEDRGIRLQINKLDRKATLFATD